MVKIENKSPTPAPAPARFYYVTDTKKTSQVARFFVLGRFFVTFQTACQRDQWVVGRKHL